MRRSRSRRVLRDAVAERPVLFLHLDEVDEDVLGPQSDGGLQAVGDSFEKRLLLLDRAAFVPGNLDHHQVVGAVDAEIVGVVQKVIGVVLVDDLKAVLWRHADADHRLIDDAADFPAIGGVLAFANIDASERHGSFSSSYQHMLAIIESICICWYLESRGDWRKRWQKENGLRTRSTAAVATAPPCARRRAGSRSFMTRRLRQAV